MRPVLDWFEQQIVFRLGRFVPIVLASLSTLVLGIAGLLFVASLIPVVSPREPVPPTPPPHVVLGIADVHSFLEQKEKREQRTVPPPQVVTRSEVHAVPSSGGDPMPASPGAIALARKIHEARKRLSALNMPWQDHMRTVCVNQMYGTCLRTENRLVARGLGSSLIELLDFHNEDERTEVVHLKEENESYLVNPSDHERKIAIVDEFLTVLNTQSSRPVRSLAEGWLELRNQHEQERLRRIAEARATAQREYQNALLAYELKQAEKQERRAQALMGVGGGLGAVFVLSLLLAVLAIERNTRELRRLQASRPVVPPWRHVDP